jgi:hypothetical protein
MGHITKKYNIIKKLASGSEGSIYKISYNNKICILKISHVLKKDLKKTLSSRIWREIDFANHMNNKYPDHFMKLYVHEIIDNCREKYFIMNLDDFTSLKLKKQYEDLLKSGYCSLKVYSYVDDNLYNMIKKINIS